MSIPAELIKPIDEIKTPSNKVLVICLILAVTGLFAWVVRLSASKDGNCKDENIRLHQQVEAGENKIDALNKYILEKSEEDNQRLKLRERYMDSVNLTLKYLNEKLK